MTQGHQQKRLSADCMVAEAALLNDAMNH